MKRIERGCGMYKHLKKVSTKGMPHEEWLEIRRKSIGGSEASAIVGMNQYTSQYAVWADKMGKLPAKDDNEPMRLGRDLEEYVAKRFSLETGIKLRRENNIIYNPDYPFAHANVDRMVIGEDAGFEAKTTSALSLSKFKNGEYPANYYVQCMHYLALTGCKRWHLGVLILGVGFKHFLIERDEAEIEALMTAEREFWEHVTSGIPPAVDGSKATVEAIKAVYPESEDTSVNLSGYESELNQYVALSDMVEDITRQRDEVANRIKAYMGDSARGESAGYKVTWSSSVRKTFDYKSFAADNPNSDLSIYFKETPSRAFKVSKIKI